MTAINSTTAESSVYHRWTPLNHHKNESITIVLECGWDGKRFTVPAQPPKSDDAVADYFNEPNGSDETVLLGSTTLYDIVKRVKSQIPTLYLMQEQGGAVLSCGSKEVHSGEWETTMLCQLVSETFSVQFTFLLIFWMLSNHSQATNCVFRRFFIYNNHHDSSRFTTKKMTKQSPI